MAVEREAATRRTVEDLARVLAEQRHANRPGLGEGIESRAAPEQRDRIIEREISFGLTSRARGATRPLLPESERRSDGPGALAWSTSRRPPSRDRRSSRSCAAPVTAAYERRAPRERSLGSVSDARGGPCPSCCSMPPAAVAHPPRCRSSARGGRRATRECATRPTRRRSRRSLP